MHLPSTISVNQIHVTDFFGSVLNVELTMEPYNLVGDEELEHEPGGGHVGLNKTR